MAPTRLPPPPPLPPRPGASQHLGPDPPNIPALRIGSAFSLLVTNPNHPTSPTTHRHPWLELIAKIACPSNVPTPARNPHLSPRQSHIRPRNQPVLPEFSADLR
ncbi:uncharacterized protein LOC143019534 [Oratosquilla oratoria]|uniref:uncharacterized protein LOC143019534 n=1 Tax=Oratosquilla oratoria TaxID=337810 RepID=UPI003F76AD2F